MKHLTTVFRTILGLLLTCLTAGTAKADNVYRGDGYPPEHFDSVEVSLLTCQPHDEVYSLYGHTAIRYHDMHGEKPLDITFNYGVFDFKKPHFVARFVFGLTDYELGACPYDLFLSEYRHFGSMVTEQVLNLTNQEKLALQQALWVNMQPENRVYRYNYFYNNCTTKARDIIESCINGQVQYAERKNYTPTYREMVHEMTRNHPWGRWGNDLLLGIKADMKTERQQQEFLPNNLMYDFDHATIAADGRFRPLVKERRTAVPAGVQVARPDFPLSPTACAIVIAVVGLALGVWQWRSRRTLMLWDVLLMLVTAVIGTVLVLMLFSQHPTVSLNLQILLFNPLPYFFLWPVVKGRKTRYWSVTAVLAVLFFLGGLFQCYAEGVWSLALCLLLQSIIHLLIMKR